MPSHVVPAKQLLQKQSETKNDWFCKTTLMCHTLSDSQPVAVSIEDRPSEERRHVADDDPDSFAGPQFKVAAAYWQVVDLQTVEYGKIQVSASLRLGEWVCCMCALLLIQAIFDRANESQGLLSSHAWVSGVLECRLDHLCRFLVHCQTNEMIGNWIDVAKANGLSIVTINFEDKKYRIKWMDSGTAVTVFILQIHCLYTYLPFLTLNLHLPFPLAIVFTLW